ncbi:hypothetical protein [Amycolatopsis sp. NPDC051903]|uniref:hypothetical protein n=1 Tax=Amycolatopsis sp. NPDC051903 TaxID=3363936 RepID=UPI0037A96DAE
MNDNIELIEDSFKHCIYAGCGKVYDTPAGAEACERSHGLYDPVDPTEAAE